MGIQEAHGIVCLDSFILSWPPWLLLALYLFLVLSFFSLMKTMLVACRGQWAAHN